VRVVWGKFALDKCNNRMHYCWASPADNKGSD